MKDYYKILGVERNASQDDIKKAFRKLAHQHHPDKKDGDSVKFKEANEAYSVLSDDKKRSQYDQFGSSAFGNGAGFDASGFGGFDFSQFTQGANGNNIEFDLGDIFGSFFGGQGRSREQARRGRDISIDTELTFSESIFGVERKISVTKTGLCDHCKGNRGEPGSEMKTCHTCQGKGKIHETKRSFIGAFASVRTCDTCAGTGKVPTNPCRKCKGAGVTKGQEDMTLKIPTGVEDGETMRIVGGGEAIAGGQAGDLYIKIHVKAHNLFRKEGNNLVADIPIKLSMALLGGDLPLKTLDGDLTVTIPTGVSHGEILRVRGKGVPVDKHKRGDLLLRISIDLPQKLSKKAKEIVEQLKEEGV